MAEITRQRQGELVRGLFGILKQHPEGLPASETLRRLEELVPPTPFENSTYPKSPNVRRYEKIVRFSTIGPVKAGWLVKDKGQWSVTEDGLKALESLTDPEAFIREATRLYRVWKKAQPEPEEAGEEIEVLKDNRPVAKIIPFPQRRQWLPASEIAYQLIRLGPDPTRLAEELRETLTDTTDDLPW